MTQNKKTHIPQKLRVAVLKRDRYQCQYPLPSGICGATELLCIHDTTHTARHASAADCITYCQTHHNQVTQQHRSALRKLRDLNAHLNAHRLQQNTLALT